MKIIIPIAIVTGTPLLMLAFFKGGYILGKRSNAAIMVLYALIFGALLFGSIVIISYKG